MDRIIYGSGEKVEVKPVQRFDFIHQDSGDRFQTFHLGAHLEPKLNSNANFQVYYRFGGRTQDMRDIAVDVDINNKAWRFIRLDGPDTLNLWVSQQSQGPEKPETVVETHLPKFPKLTEELLVNGTFQFSDTRPKYAYIRELDLLIHNILDFTRACEYEPFLRVSNVEGLGKAEMNAHGSLPWSSKSGDRVVMRTASFGQGRHGLDMCIKEGRIGSRGQDGEGRVADELMVPLAIVSALRHRVWEVNGRTFSCL